MTSFCCCGLMQHIKAIITSEEVSFLFDFFFPVTLIIRVLILFG